MQSRLAGHLEPFTQVDLYLSKGRTWDVITQAQTMQNFQGLRADLILTAWASCMLELADRFSANDGPNPPLYRLLVNSLQRLEGPYPAETVVRYFEVHMLDQIGFRPEFQRCVACGAEVQAEDQYFSPLLGGVLCPDSLSADPAAWKISVEALRYLRFFQRSAWSEVSTRELPGAVSVELKAYFEAYWAYLLEYRLRSPGFLDSIQ